MASNEFFDVAIIGGGSAAEALVGRLHDRAGGRPSCVVFEPRLVGGECPFLACMPSKSMLHDARLVARRDDGPAGAWRRAVEHRDQVVEHLDDGSHADQVREQGAELVRERARVAGRSDGRGRYVVQSESGRRFDVDHVVVATGAEVVAPPVEGLDELGELRWTSEDALVATRRPERLLLIGGGVVGIELATTFAAFGTTVTLTDPSPRAMPELTERVGRIVEASLRSAGVQVGYGVEVASIERRDREVIARLSDGGMVVADRVLVAAGRRPSLGDLGLDSIGLDPDDLRVDDRLRVQGAERVWAIGDAAGREQYTHVANHHAAVVAAVMCGDGDVTAGGPVVPACVFVEPPVIVVGPTRDDLASDDDVVWAEQELSVARQSTDHLGDGFLAVAARRSTGTVVAAHGVGPRFDEIVHALVVAIDGEVPVATLARSMQPFPTVGEILGPTFARLVELTR